MLRIKLFAMILVVGLAGVGYAAGVQTGSHHDHGAQSAGKAPACCQKKDAPKDGQQATAMSCDKDGCCRGHKADAGQASAKAAGESCCDGGSCCRGHQQKAGAEAAVVKTSADAQEAKSCCGAGAACCKDGADCCRAHKAAGQATAAEHKHEGCDCCGDSCAAHTGR